jgi:hypothetical protein
MAFIAVVFKMVFDSQDIQTVLIEIHQDTDIDILGGKQMRQPLSSLFDTE